jgi:hypothetical protein
MSSKKSAPALQIEFGRSRYLCLFVLLSHCGAVMAVAFTAIAPLFRVALAAVVLVSLYRNWRRLTPEFAVLRCDSVDQWWLYDRNGGEHIAELLPGSYVHPWFTVLRFRVNRSVHDLVLTPDNACRTSLRRLRVRLKQWH